MSDYEKVDLETAAYNRGFHHGQEMGFGEGIRMGHIQAVSEALTLLTNVMTNLTQGTAKDDHDKDSE